MKSAVLCCALISNPQEHTKETLCIMIQNDMFLLSQFPFALSKLKSWLNNIILVHGEISYSFVCVSSQAFLCRASNKLMGISRLRFYMDLAITPHLSSLELSTSHLPDELPHANGIPSTSMISLQLIKLDM